MLRIRDWLILLFFIALAVSVLLFGHDVCGGGACGSAPGTP